MVEPLVQLDIELSGPCSAGLYLLRLAQGLGRWQDIVPGWNGAFVGLLQSRGSAH